MLARIINLSASRSLPFLSSPSVSRFLPRSTLHQTASRFLSSAPKMAAPVVIPRAERVAHFEQDGE